MLHLPKGFEAVGGYWFVCSDIQKVIIPNTVRELGETAFGYCRQLREVVFEPGSQLETIGVGCFDSCGLEEVTVPRSVRNIGSSAFINCQSLRSFTFEEGSQLAHVGKHIVDNTMLDPDEIEFPSTVRTGGNEETGFADASVYDYTDSDES